MSRSRTISVTTTPPLDRAAALRLQVLRDRGYTPEDVGALMANWLLVEHEFTHTQKEKARA